MHIPLPRVASWKILWMTLPLAGLGNAQTILRDQPEPSGEVGYGFHVKTLVDYDGDGIPEYFVGAPFVTAGGASNSGHGFVYSGATGALRFTLQVPFSTLVNQNFGFSACSAGDFDNDGVTDILVGAPGHWVNASHARRGAIYAFSGATGNFIQSWVGNQMRRQLGGFLDSMGDLDGDGKSEFLLSVAMDEYFVPGYVEVRSGSTGDVIHHFTENTGDVPTPTAAVGDVDGDGHIDWAVHSTYFEWKVHSGLTGQVLFTAAISPAAIRSSIAGVGDVNGDGFADVGFGVPAHDVVYVYSGLSGTLLYTLQGESGSYFGQGIDGVGDINGDGMPDIAVGSPRYGPQGSLEGRLDVYAGAAGTWLYGLTGSEMGNLRGYGHSIAGFGDLNGDSLGDFVVGASGPTWPTFGGVQILGRSLTGPEQVQICVGSTHSEGQRARLFAASPSQFAVASNDLTLGVVGLPTNIPTTAMMLVSNQFGLIANPVIGGAASGGTLCIAGGGIGRFNAQGEYYFGSLGSFRLEPNLNQIPWVIPPFTTAIQPGESWLWQCWYRDTGSGQGSSQFSDAISIRFQ